MRVLADRLDAGLAPDVPLLESIIQFLRTYADRCHHGKEEALLFPALVLRGVPSQGCPLGGLTMEHQKGRAMVGELAEAVRVCAPPAARLRDLAAFYENHIWKEDNLLFPLAGRLLTLEDQGELKAKFEAVEQEIGMATYERLEGFGQELEAAVR